ncbi:MAG: hypothetical protein ACREJN_16115 [Nitrospiraceae bacterium]
MQATRSTVKIFLLPIMVCVIAIGQVACTYNGALRQDFHQQSGDFGGKLPLKVSVVADPTIKTYARDKRGHSTFPG